MGKHPQRVPKRESSLGYLFPEIAAQLADKSLDPFKIPVASRIKFEWVCSKQPVCLECGTEHRWTAAVYSRTGESQANCPFCSGKGQSTCKCTSLQWKFPEIAAQLADKTIDPFTVRAYSNVRYDWICSKQPVCQECGTEHRWNVPVNSRTGTCKSGCPFCSGKGQVVCKCKSLQWKFPAIALQLYDKTLDPLSIAASSSKKYEWHCSRNPEHVWSMTVGNRTGLGQGCPYCSRKRVTREWSLGHCFPDVATELLNKSIDPF